MTDLGGASGQGAANSSSTIREAIDPADLGRATLSSTGAFVAGSMQTFTLVYTAGAYGIDDSGSLRVCWRFAADHSKPQFSDPKGAGFTTVIASNGAVLDCRYDPKGNVRPWDRTLYIKVVQGCLAPGDTITVVFGDTSEGGPGMRVQTFVENSFEFRVLVDPIATFNYQPLPEQNAIAVVPGEPVRYVAVWPTLRRAGEAFALKVKGEDVWGNVSDRCDATLRLRASAAVEGLPATVTLAPGSFSAVIDGLSVAQPGDVALWLEDESGAKVAEAPPLRVVANAELTHYWMDAHGQSEETIGSGSARDYFAFARDKAFLDIAAHQGNDFQMHGTFWRHLNALTAAFNEDGRFVTLPGYEWSGNTALGGDRNVYFSEENRTIRRSSHALIDDRSDVATDCRTANELFAAFAAAGEWDVVCFAHCGGRYADINLAHDGRFERSVEVHSSWGTFEWLVEDAFKAGYRVGIVGNSDGHKGRPGASYPGSSNFGAIGGLTCLLLPELSRAAVLDGLRKRRHYATTGGPSARMVIELRAAFDAPGTRYHDDPALFDAAGDTVSEALIGDIVHLPDGGVTLHGDLLAAAPIERVDLFNGLEHLETLRTFAAEQLGRRLRIVWQGAEYRGRARDVAWDGGLTVRGNRILRAAPINFFNPDRELIRDGDRNLRWRSVTTGNFAGVDLWLDGDGGEIAIETSPIKATVAVAEIGAEEVAFAADALLPKRLRVLRLPETLSERALTFARRVALRAHGDNPLYLRLTQEDGTQAWTSPIYVYR